MNWPRLFAASLAGNSRQSFWQNPARTRRAVLAINPATEEKEDSLAMDHVNDKGKAHRVSLGSFTSFLPLRLLRVDAPLGRGSRGRFGLRRFRAQLNPTAFGTHRAFPRALPPALRLRSVLFPVPLVFVPLPLQ